MTIPTSQPLPPEIPEPMSPARRRRRQRRIIPGATDQQALFIEELAHNVTPSADYFLFALLSVLVLSAAIILDMPVLFFLAALLAPFMGTVFGMSLGVATGAPRFFLQSLGGVTLAGLIYFLGGALAGWASNFFWKEVPVIPTQIFYHSVFSWPDLLVLVLGTVISIMMLVQYQKQKPLVSSVAIAYELFLPAGVAGFGLTSGIPGLLINALLVAVINLLVAVLLGSILLTFTGIKPRESWNFSFGSGAVILVGIILIGLGGLGPLPLKPIGTPTLMASSAPVNAGTATATQKPAGIVKSFTSTPVPPTQAKEVPGVLTTATLTLTPTNTLVPTQTFTPTATIAPTPVYGKVNAKEGSGAVVREKPEYTAKVVKQLLNGSLVEILPDTFEQAGIVWYKVRLAEGLDGWMVRYVLITATPQN